MMVVLNSAQMIKSGAYTRVFPVVILMLPLLSAAQDTGMISKNRLFVSLNNGVMYNKATCSEGDYAPKSAWSYNHMFRFAYQRNLKENFSLQGGFGLGMQGLDYDVPDGETNPENFGWRYFERAVYTSTVEADLLAGYKLRLHFRPDVWIRGGGGMQTNYSFDYWSEYRLNGNINFLLTGEIFGSVRPFITFGSDILFPLKNYDQIQLGIHYKQFFSDWYSGEFIFYGGESTGTIHSRGSYCSLGLGYVFTSEKKARTLQSLGTEAGSGKNSRKTYRRQRRIIDPFSKSIGLYGGVAILKTSFSDDANIFRTVNIPTTSGRITYEQGIGSGLFLEAGYHLQLYYSGHKIVPELSESADQSELSTNSTWYFGDYFTHDFSLGMGYRVPGIHGGTIVNIHGGIFSGFHAIPIGPDGSGYGYFKYNDSGIPHIIDYQSTDHILSNLSLGVYGGASKDLRLTDRLYLSVMYRYQAGVIKLSEYRYQYQVSPSGESGTATGFFRNTGHFVMVGLKYRW